MSGQRTRAADEDAVDALRAAAREYRAARNAVDEHGRETLETLAEELRTARTLLAEGEDKATDTGAREFLNFAQFKGSFSNHVESLDDDLPARDAFERAFEVVDKRRLGVDDVERAREALEPAADVVERLDDLEDARDQLVEARKRAEARRAELREAVAERERLLELGDADLDAPVEELRDPVERWNDAVDDAVDALRTDAPAREALAALERAELYPLVDLPSPPDSLQEYLHARPAGEEPVARLLEYAEFSQSKLDHYVEDPGRFRRVIGTERSTLEAIQPEPLQVEWPPPPAAVVPWRVRSLRGAVGGLVDDDAVAALRDLRAAARDDERYRRLRDAAVARAELGEDERERLASGAVEEELAERRAAVERIEEALDEAPDP